MLGSKKRYVRPTSVVCLLLLSLARCGGATSSREGGAGGATGAAQGYCEAESAWRSRCSFVGELMCGNLGAACLSKIYRPEALVILRDCEQALSCSSAGDQCFTEVVLTDQLPSAAEFASACAAKNRACGKSSQCSVPNEKGDGYFAAIRACLDEPCDAVDACQIGLTFEAICSR